MVLEEIDLTGSDDEEEAEAGSAAPQPPQPPQPVTPIKCKSEDPSDAPVGDGEDGGLTPATTGGKGLWSLWTRNFKSPLLMLLDLVDNAVDAAMPSKGDDEFTGRVHIYRDLYEAQPGQVWTTGLCLRNNSHQKIAPMKEVLQLFISAKANSGSESIGENGVGLKQSCAALGDNSFVLVKNGPDTFELGIIAKSLQQEDKMILPSFEFQGGEAHVGQQMLEMLAKPQYQEVANVVAEYGRVRSGGNASVARGVARLNKKFEDLRLNWDAEEYVFEVVIDKITHRGKPEGEGLEDKSAAVKDVIQELQHEIPRRYLNIPESFKFVVGKKALTFTYWPERLVEFTKVEIPVRSKIPWDDDFGEQTPDSYWLRIYLGFDRYRIKDSKTAVRKQRKVCSLYIYSRASGRMVQHEPDARSILSLVAGGTDYCQALTIIVDDIEGYLPLDPTKQGIAFGNEAHGDTHKDNLFTVMSCVVRFFYAQHKNKYGGSKAVLSKKILDYSGDDVDIPDLKTCRDSELTDYGVLFNMTKDHRIIVDRTCYKDEIIGSDTHFRLLPDAEAKPQKRKAATAGGKKASASASNAAPAKKKQRAFGAAQSPAEKKQPAKASKPPPRVRGSRASPRKSSKPVQYADAGSDDEEEDSDDDSGDAHHVEGLGELLHQVGGCLKSPMDAKPCEALGAGWTKRTVPRKHPKGGTKNDSFYFSPGGTKFKSMAEARRHLVKTEMDSGEADEGPIDLCSSSDEDEDDVNEGGPAEAGSEGARGSPNAVSESEQNDTAESEPARSLKAENAKLRGENDELKARNGSLETELEELKAELEKSKADLEKSKRAISALTGRLGASDEEAGPGNDVEVKADPGVTVADVLNAK